MNSQFFRLQLYIDTLMQSEPDPYYSHDDAKVGSDGGGTRTTGQKGHIGSDSKGTNQTPHVGDEDGHKDRVISFGSDVGFFKSVGLGSENGISSNPGNCIGSGNGVGNCVGNGVSPNRTNYGSITNDHIRK